MQTFYNCKKVLDHKVQRPNIYFRNLIILSFKHHLNKNIIIIIPYQNDGIVGVKTFDLFDASTNTDRC